MRVIAASVCFSLLFLLPVGPTFAEDYYILETEEAITVGQGNLKTEIEFGVTKQPDASELYNIPRIRATYGLSDWADLEIEGEFLTVRDTDFFEYDNGKAHFDEDSSGGGDVKIRVKATPYEFDRHLLGFLFSTKLPNASESDGLGTNETDLAVQALLSSDWGRFKTHLNIGFASLGDPTRNNNQDDYFIWGIAAEYPLNDSLTLMAEIEGSTAGDNSTEGFTENIAEGSEGGARGRIRVALTGPIGSWMWGVSAFKGVNSHTEDWGAQIGLSKTWGIGGPTEPATAPLRADARAESYYNPMKTEEAYTIEERNFRTDIAFGYINQPDDSDLFITPDLNFGWGLGPWADLQIGLQALYSRDNAIFDANGNVVREDLNDYGKGDVRIKLKVSPFEWKCGRLGFHVLTKAPLAEDDEGLGTDEVDVAGKFLFSTDWSHFFSDSPLSKLKTHLNAGVAIQGDPYELARQNDYFIWGVAAEYEMTPCLTLWGEVEGSTNGDESQNISVGDYGNAYGEARLGLTGPMPDIDYLRDWTWGLTAGAGLNSHSRDFTATIGMSRSWGE